MAVDSIVRARIDTPTKEAATKVLDQMGLSVSDAIRLLMVRIAAEEALPFDIKVPNRQTVAAMQEFQRGETRRFASVSDLMADLNADD